MRKYTCTIGIFCLSIINSFAQLNESDTVKLQFRVSLTGIYQEGNVEVLTVRSKLDLVFSPHRDWVFKSQNSSLYQAFYSREADNDIFSRNYLYFKPQHRLYPFAIAYISKNFRRKIGNRYFAGAGVTFQLINKPKNVLKIAASTLYEATTFRGIAYNYREYNGYDKIDLWRGTLYIGGWNYFLQDHIRMYYDTYWQPAFNNSHNYRIQFDVGAEVPVWKGFSFNAVYAYTHENLVIKGIKQADKMLTFGFAYNYRKK